MKILCGWLLFLGFCLSHGFAETDVGPLEMKEMKLPGYEGQVREGVLEVFEDRAAGTGRKIPIKVVVVSAKAEKPEPDPFFIFLGGPGQGAATLAGFLIEPFEAILEKRDLVMVDIRGTGASNPLNCGFNGPEDALQTYLDDMFTEEYVNRCREDLSQRAILALYTTTLAMQDVNDVRIALGYDQINLSGGSYGTRSALEFMRLYPKHVRTAILNGLAPVTVPIPQHFARDAQAALDALINACEADPECTATFPQFSAIVAEALNKFDEGPITQTVQNPQTKKPETVVLKRGPFLTALRAMLYNGFRSKDIPFYVAQAAKGDFEPFILFGAQYTKALSEGLSDGFYLSVTCAEDLPFVDMPAARAEAEGTFLGTYRLDQQTLACENWPRGPIDPEYRQPLKSDIPTLLLSGTVDPVTPPYMGDLVGEGLSKAVHLVFPNAAHGVSVGRECAIRAVVSFVENMNGNAIDRSCITQVKRQPFTLSADKKAEE